MKTAIKILTLAMSGLMLVSCAKKKYINEPGNLVPKTVDQDLSLPSITVNGAMLHSEAFGPKDSTLIIALHGGPGNDYRPLLNMTDFTNHGYRVVFFDQRGTGLSQRFPKESYTSLGTGALDVMYEDLRGVIEYYRTSPNQKVYLVGKSWGGMVATAYAGKYPNEVNGLVVVDPGGLKWDDIMEYMKASRAFNAAGETVSDITYVDQFITGNEDDHATLDFKAAMAAADNAVTGETSRESGSFWRIGAVQRNALAEIGMKHKPDFSAGISNFNTPVLYMYTEKNRVHPTSWAQKVSSAYNSVELFKVMGAGHSSVITDKQIWTNTTMPKMLSYFKSLK
jgi:proline iminopeptidase